MGKDGQAEAFNGVLVLLLPPGFPSFSGALSAHRSTQGDQKFARKQR